jgi:DNA-directed RNA polymerase specialized sigma24 family protein
VTPPVDRVSAALGRVRRALWKPTARRRPGRGTLLRALDALPEAERAAVALVHLHGLSSVVAAARLGCSERALKALLNRGLIALYRQVDGERGADRVVVADARGESRWAAASGDGRPFGARPSG